MFILFEVTFQPILVWLFGIVRTRPLHLIQYVVEPISFKWIKIVSWEFHESLLKVINSIFNFSKSQSISQYTNCIYHGATSIWKLTLAQKMTYQPLHMIGLETLDQQEVRAVY